MCLCRRALKVPPLGPNPQWVVMGGPRKMWEDQTGGDWCPASHLKCWEEVDSRVPHANRITIVKWERQSRYREQGSETDPLHTDAMLSLLHLQHLKETLSDQSLDHSARLRGGRGPPPVEAAGWAASVREVMGKAEFHKLSSQQPELSQTRQQGRKLNPAVQLP